MPLRLLMDIKAFSKKNHWAPSPKPISNLNAGKRIKFQKSFFDPVKDWGGIGAQTLKFCADNVAQTTDFAKDFISTSSRGFFLAQTCCKTVIIRNAFVQKEFLC